MTKPISYEDVAWKVSQHHVYLCEDEVSDEIKGVVYTAHGIVNVDVWNEPGTGTVLELVHGGLIHRRRYAQAMSMRGVVTKARRFAREIAEVIDGD